MYFDTHPNVLAVIPAFIPSTQINVVTPLMDLCVERVINFRLHLESTVKLKDIEWADIVVLCRNIEPGQAWFYELLQQDKPYIYDIDDNFFDINTSEASYYRSPERLDMFTQYLRNASLVRVYSEPLRLRILELHSRVVKVVPPLDFRHVLSRRAANEDKVKIVYATSRTHDELFSIFLPALEKILHYYNNQVQVYFLGFTPPELRKHPGVYSVPMIWDYPAYLRKFSSAGYDIGLAPLLDDVFHRSKTNNKFREYGACQIAGIYSNVDVYASCVQHNQTGILVSNEEKAWYDALALLIENPDLRRKIQLSAYDFVRSNYSQTEFVKSWAQQIKNIFTDTKQVKHSIETDLPVKNYNQINKQGIIKKIYDKFVHSDGLSSFIAFLFQGLRRKIFSMFLFWKYKFLIWRARTGNYSGDHTSNTPKIFP